MGTSTGYMAEAGTDVEDICVETGEDAERIAGSYPLLPRFRELGQRLDPGGCFVNEDVRSLGIR